MAAPRTVIDPADYDEWCTLSVRLWCPGGPRRMVKVDHLSDQEIRWVARVLTNELMKREKGQKTR